MENKDQKKQNTNYENVIKVGTFQLQTKSFWLGLVSILILYLLSVLWLTNYYWCKVLDNNKQIVQMIIEKQNIKK